MERVRREIQTILFKRLFITIGILLILRLGTLFPVPGINQVALSSYIQTQPFTRNIISMFSSKNTFVIGLFTLNIFPYINASILIQLILAFSPKLSKLQKEGDLSGRRYINRLTKIFTLIWAIIQSVSLTVYLKQILYDWNYKLAFEIVMWLITGAMIVLWLSELITEYGLGNGSSLLIYINIISSLPNLIRTFFLENSQNYTILSLFQTFGLIIISLYGIVFLQQGVRIVPLISSKQLNQGTNQNLETSNNYLPLRFNQAGVMPIILTTAVLVVPNYVNNLGLFPKILLPIPIELSKILYWCSYFLLSLVFSSFYSTIVLNPKDISDQLQRMAVAIPGVRPGIQTTFYLKQVMKRVTIIGSIMLATLTTVPNFLESTLNITNLNGLSISSLFILAGVILDLAREINNIYYSNIYNNIYQ